MAATEWIEQRLESRQRAARARLIRQHRRTTSKSRARTRDVARIVLVATVLVLGVLAVEIGRKAVTVINHASVAGVAVSIG